MSDQPEEVNMGSSIWQSQPVEAPRVSLEFIRHQVEKKSRSLKNERDMFYVVTTGAIFTALAFMFKQWSAHDWNALNIVIDISMLLFGVGALGMGLHVRHNLYMKRVDPDIDVVRGLATYRSEVERLAQLAYREWHVLPYCAPGYLTLLAGGLIFDQRPGKVLRYGFTIVAGVASVAFALWVGRKRSRCLQRELDAIASLK